MKASRPTAADSIVGSRRPEDNRCWLCGTAGIPDRTLRADVHVSGHLCLRCWGLQPRGRNPCSRACRDGRAALPGHSRPLHALNTAPSRPYGPRHDQALSPAERSLIG